MKHLMATSDEDRKREEQEDFNEGYGLDDEEFEDTEEKDNE
jgi:hypothetical protein